MLSQGEYKYTCRARVLALPKHCGKCCIDRTDAVWLGLFWYFSCVCASRDSGPELGGNRNARGCGLGDAPGSCCLMLDKSRLVAPTDASVDAKGFVVLRLTCGLKLQRRHRSLRMKVTQRTISTLVPLPPLVLLLRLQG